MAITAVFFQSVNDFQKHVDQSIAESKTLLGKIFTITEEVRKRYDVERTRSTNSDNSKVKTVLSKETKQVELAGFKVLVNPTTDYELRLMEESATSIQERIDAFEKIKELYPRLSQTNMRIGMILNDGMPSGFMFFTASL
jgi:hypothetical protein